MSYSPPLYENNEPSSEVQDEVYYGDPANGDYYDGGGGATTEEGAYYDVDSPT